MFKLFKSSKVTSKLVVKDSKETQIDEAKLIEEIHESFFTEVDKLLAWAKISSSLETTKQSLIDKRDKLVELGFTNTKEVVEAEEEVRRLELIKEENQNKISLKEAIDYFSTKYPHYKFITEESVKKICEKYGLVYGEVSKYKGTVPDKNLKQIQDFKIESKDECCIKIINPGAWMMLDTYVSGNNTLGTTSIEGIGLVTIRKSPLEIAAPLKDFDMKEHEVKNFKLSKIEVKDPVVLKPVFFKGQKHYLIVTAWGLEASDELVINPRHN